MRTQTFSDADIAALKRGETIQIRPHGRSMEPRIFSGNLCTIAPIVEPLAVRDAVLVEIGRTRYLHIVRKIGDGKVLIGNNRGDLNGWAPRENVYGRLIRVEP